MSQRTSSLNTKECSCLTVRAFFTIIERKRTHEGEIYGKSNIWRKKRGSNLQNRYGVYAVIPDANHEKIILVQAPNGAWFLPGGEIEEGENHLEALKRELIEELGILQLKSAPTTGKLMNISIPAIVIPTTTIQPISTKPLLTKKSKNLSKTSII